MGRSKICGRPVEVLSQVHCATGIGQVLCVSEFTHIYLASSCILCTHGWVNSQMFKWFGSQISMGIGCYEKRRVDLFLKFQLNLSSLQRRVVVTQCERVLLYFVFINNLFVSNEFRWRCLFILHRFLSHNIVLLNRLFSFNRSSSHSLHIIF